VAKEPFLNSEIFHANSEKSVSISGVQFLKDGDINTCTPKKCKGENLWGQWTVSFSRMKHT